MDIIHMLDCSSAICALDLAKNISALYCYGTGEQQLLAIDLQQKDSFTWKIFSHNAGFHINFYFSLKVGHMYPTFFFYSQ